MLFSYLGPLLPMSLLTKQKKPITKDRPNASKRYCKESTGIINACHRALSILNIFAKPHSTAKPFHCILKRVKCLWVNVWVNNSHCAWGAYFKLLLSSVSFTYFHKSNFFKLLSISFTHLADLFISDLFLDSL